MRKGMGQETQRHSGAQERERENGGADTYLTIAALAAIVAPAAAMPPLLG